MGRQAKGSFRRRNGKLYASVPRPNSTWRLEVAVVDEVEGQAWIDEQLKRVARGLEPE
jgi:hypothetical protein